MIKMFIVDDESIIRTGIKNSIDWGSFDVEIAGEAKNGREALSKAIELNPDIVITDIRMPVMDGLELTQSLKEHVPNTKIIILSGYNDFEYAKKAIELGVCEYLLKPVGAEELVKLVLKLKDQIINESKKRDMEISAQLLFNENLPYIQSKFIDNLLKGENEDKKTILERAAILKTDLSGPKYQVIIIDVDDYLLITEYYPEKDKDLLKYSVLNIADEILSSNCNGSVFFSEFDYLIGIINVKNETKAAIIDICKEIQFCITRYLKLSVTIGIGSVSECLDDISVSYNEALISLRNKMYSGKSRIIHIDMIDKGHSNPPLHFSTEDEKELLNSLRTMNIENVYKIIDKLFTGFIETKAGYNHIKSVCLRLIMLSASALEEIGINVESPFGEDFQPDVEIKKYETIENIEEWLKSLFNSFINVMQENKNNKYKSIVKFSIQYINEHYSEAFSLCDVASKVYVTPNYLSKVFKQETGENFVEWINQFRINKAKTLLTDIGSKTYEIAEKVGYNDYKHFSYNFKKYTGYTPKEFKELR